MLRRLLASSTSRGRGCRGAALSILPSAAAPAAAFACLRLRGVRRKLSTLRSTGTTASVTSDLSSHNPRLDRGHLPLRPSDEVAAKAALRWTYTTWPRSLEEWQRRVSRLVIAEKMNQRKGNGESETSPADEDSSDNIPAAIHELLLSTTPSSVQLLVLQWTLLFYRKQSIDSDIAHANGHHPLPASPPFEPNSSASSSSSSSSSSSYPSSPSSSSSSSTAATEWITRTFSICEALGLHIDSDLVFQLILLWHASIQRQCKFQMMDSKPFTSSSPLQPTSADSKQQYFEDQKEKPLAEINLDLDIKSGWDRILAALRYCSSKSIRIAPEKVVYLLNLFYSSTLAPPPKPIIRACIQFFMADMMTVSDTNLYKVIYMLMYQQQHKYPQMHWFHHPYKQQGEHAFPKPPPESVHQSHYASEGSGDRELGDESALISILFQRFISSRSSKWDSRNEDAKRIRNSLLILFLHHALSTNNPHVINECLSLLLVKNKFHLHGKMRREVLTVLKEREMYDESVLLLKRSLNPKDPMKTNDVFHLILTLGLRKSREVETIVFIFSLLRKLQAPRNMCLGLHDHALKLIWSGNSSKVIPSLIDQQLADSVFDGPVIIANTLNHITRYQMRDVYLQAFNYIYHIVAALRAAVDINDETGMHNDSHGVARNGNSSDDAYMILRQCKKHFSSAAFICLVQSLFFMKSAENQKIYDIVTNRFHYISRYGEHGEQELGICLDSLIIVLVRAAASGNTVPIQQQIPSPTLSSLTSSSASSFPDSVENQKAGTQTIALQSSSTSYSEETTSAMKHNQKAGTETIAQQQPSLTSYSEEKSSPMTTSSEKTQPHGENGEQQLSPESVAELPTSIDADENVLAHEPIMQFTEAEFDKKLRESDNEEESTLDSPGMGSAGSQDQEIVPEGLVQAAANSNTYAILAIGSNQIQQYYRTVLIYRICLAHKIKPSPSLMASLLAALYNILRNEIIRLRGPLLKSRSTQKLYSHLQIEGDINSNFRRGYPEKNSSSKSSSPKSQLSVLSSSLISSSVSAASPATSTSSSTSSNPFNHDSQMVIQKLSNDAQLVRDLMMEHDEIAAVIIKNKINNSSSEELALASKEESYRYQYGNESAFPSMNTSSSSAPSTSIYEVSKDDSYWTKVDKKKAATFDQFINDIINKNISKRNNEGKLEEKSQFDNRSEIPEDKSSVIAMTNQEMTRKSNQSETTPQSNPIDDIGSPAEMEISEEDGVENDNMTLPTLKLKDKLLDNRSRIDLGSADEFDKLVKEVEHMYDDLMMANQFGNIAPYPSLPLTLPLTSAALWKKLNAEANNYNNHQESSANSNSDTSPPARSSVSQINFSTERLIEMAGFNSKQFQNLHEEVVLDMRLITSEEIKPYLTMLKQVFDSLLGRGEVDPIFSDTTSNEVVLNVCSLICCRLGWMNMLAEFDKKKESLGLHRHPSVTFARLSALEFMFNYKEHDELAESLLQSAKNEQLPHFLFNRILTSFIERGRYRDALITVKMITDPELMIEQNYHTTGLLMKMFSRIGNLHMCERLYQYHCMQRPMWNNVRSKLYMMNAASFSSNHDAVLKLFNEILESRDNESISIAISILIDTYKKIGMVAEATNIFAEVVAMYSPKFQCLSTNSFTTMIELYHHHHLRESAIATARKLIELNIPMNVKFARNLLAGFSPSNWISPRDSELALEAFELVLERDARLIEILAKQYTRIDDLSKVYFLRRQGSK